MEAQSHIGEAAELYALGSLTEEERAAVDAHVRECAACLRRVGEAEETVLALERGFVASAPVPRRVLPFERRNVSAWWIPAAAAAAFVAGMFFARPNEPNLATVAMIHSHFAHAQFSGGGPAAKVIYARDRSWYYVIVDAARGYEVYGITGGRASDLGTTRRSGGASDLFARVDARFDRIELRDGATVVETAAIR